MVRQMALLGLFSTKVVSAGLPLLLRGGICLAGRGMVAERARPRAQHYPHWDASGIGKKPLDSVHCCARGRARSAKHMPEEERAGERRNPKNDHLVGLFQAQSAANVVSQVVRALLSPTLSSRRGRRGRKRSSSLSHFAGVHPATARLYGLRAQEFVHGLPA